MKIAVMIARILLGLEFLVFGLNGFLHFLPMPPPAGQAGQYMGILFASHALFLVFFLEGVGGLLLLANRYVPLALVLLGPVLVNILEFHILLAPEGLPIAIFTLVLFGLVLYGARKAFSGIFAVRLEA